MTRYIDADALIEAMTKFSNATGEDMTHGIFYAHIAPTVDAVPVIRCKDCKNNPSTSVGWISCPMTGAGTRKPNDFCSYAEPKEK